MESEQLIRNFNACIRSIAKALKEVGHPVVCAGVDVDGHVLPASRGGHTAETICAAIHALSLEKYEKGEDE